MEEMSFLDSLGYVLYNLAKKRQWEKVAKIYKENTTISCYNPKSPNHAHERCTEEMFTFMRECGSVSKLVRMPNVRGDTPLHLAAAVGWEAICRKIASLDPMLIEIRNSNGETPLFISAHHGNLHTFVALHGIYNHGKDRVDESLCRREADGNTVLHSAISGEYFGLAYFILEHYKNLLNYVNVDGETPLYVLARKPNLFKSSSQLGFYESIIYHFVFVDNLKNQPIHNPKDTQIDDSSEENFPENYQTCVRIFRLIMGSNFQYL
ncbi:ankyrin repeat, PH and SEC7 domain containing protein secG-like [Salvia hispanica]|uniref:ankyrin repeat, PH and SEC7 domain containing protein secG-like n=1 Tax=Salvia hispanica TaxID=49212 RepID=UPI002008F38A|nr:ankyrin repeat, PH and SEC7 domain containing protein secG-like [Salvia hispanica]